MNKVIVKQAVEYVRGCFIEHNINTATGEKFYTVKYPSGVALDYKSLCAARRSTNK